MFRFEDPLVLGLLVALPVLFWVRASRRRRPAIRYSAVSDIQAAGVSKARVMAILPPTLRGLALAAFIVALARPQTGITTENVLTKGIDIVMVLDVSSSMLAEDLEPNRLEAAQGSRYRLRRRSEERPHRPRGICWPGLHTGATHL